MSWNHRVVRRVVDGETTHAIHEAYYDKKGLVWAITQDPEPVVTADEDGMALGEVYQMMGEAFDHPVLDYDKIPEEGAEAP